MTVQSFRKKPVVVQAVQWTGGNETEVRAFAGGSNFGVCSDEPPCDPEITAHVYDELHSTWVGVKTGQWIIRGVKGEFYPIDQTVLAETYEPAGSGAGDA